MKKLLLLFGIASVLLLGNINSATAGSWVVFIPDYTLNNPNPPESVIYEVGLLQGYCKMTFITGPRTGGSGQINFIMTGGTKYRVSYSSINSLQGSGSLVTPNGAVQPGIPVEWTNGNCFFRGGGVCYYGVPGYVEILGLKFERYQ